MHREVHVNGTDVWVEEEANVTAVFDPSGASACEWPGRKRHHQLLQGGGGRALEQMSRPRGGDVFLAARVRPHPDNALRSFASGEVVTVRTKQEFELRVGEEMLAPERKMKYIIFIRVPEALSQSTPTSTSISQRARAGGERGGGDRTTREVRLPAVAPLLNEMYLFASGRESEVHSFDAFAFVFASTCVGTDRNVSSTIRLFAESSRLPRDSVLSFSCTKSISVVEGTTRQRLGRVLHSACTTVRPIPGPLVNLTIMNRGTGRSKILFVKRWA